MYVGTCKFLNIFVNIYLKNFFYELKMILMRPNICMVQVIIVFRKIDFQFSTFFNFIAIWRVKNLNFTNGAVIGNVL